MVERETGPTHRPWNGANRALVTAIEWFGLRCLCRFPGVRLKQHAISGIKDPVLENMLTCLDEGGFNFLRIENRFGLPVRRAERSGSAAEHVSKRRKKAKWSEAKRQTEAATNATAPTDAVRDERAVCEGERAWSRGGRGRPVCPWSAAIRALVTTVKAVRVKSRN